MDTPEDALARARAAADAMRGGGAYADDRDQLQLEPGPVTVAKLSEWALIEPDLRDVRSTRRFGAPMTALKRGLLRLLSQYHAELLAQQTRFNVSLLNEVRKLEQRVAELESRLPRRPPSG